MLRKAIIGVVLALGASPSIAQLFDDNEARRRIEVLRQQVEASRKDTEERLAKAEAAAVDRGALLDLANQIERMREDVARMRGQLEVLGNQADTSEARQKQLYLDIDTRLRKLEQAKEQQAAIPEKPPAPPAGGRARASARRGQGLPGCARPVQARQLRARRICNAGLSRHLSVESARAERAVLDRHGLLRPARLQERHQRAAQAPRRLARQPESARRHAVDRERAGNHGRSQVRPEDSRRPHRQISRVKLRDERQAAPRRLRQATLNPQELAPYVAGGAFALAFIFGAVGNKTNFCAMGAVSDWVNMGDTGRLRMWLLAVAVALLGSSVLHLAGLVDLSKSIYPGPNFTWLSYLVGGFLFGVGMTLGSGCGSKTLIRVGAGNLKSLVVYIFLGIAAYMTLRGLLGAFRVGVLEKATITLPQG